MTVQTNPKSQLPTQNLAKIILNLVVQEKQKIDLGSIPTFADVVEHKTNFFGF